MRETRKEKRNWVQWSRGILFLLPARQYLIAFSTYGRTHGKKKLLLRATTVKGTLPPSEVTYNGRLMQSPYRKVQIKAVKTFIPLARNFRCSQQFFSRFFVHCCLLAPFFSAGALCFQAATAVNSRQSVRDLLEVGHNYARYGRLIGKTPAVPLLHRRPRYCAFTLAASRILAF